MAVAYFKVHAPHGGLPILNQGELAVLYCFLFLYMGQPGLGPLFDLLRRLGLVSDDANWFSGHWSALLLVVVSVTWKFVGMQMLLLLAGLQSGRDKETAEELVRLLVEMYGEGLSRVVTVLGEHDPELVARIAGDEVRLRSPQDALRRGVATVFQELTLLEGMTVAENLLIGHETRGPLKLIRRRAQPDAAGEILAEHGVDSIDPGELVENLPLAQKQLVEIVHACMREPKVLILDEPTSALTRREVDWLFDTVRRLRDGGACVIFTSHRWSEVTDLADRITVFRNGTDVGTHDTLDEAEAVKLMTGREVSTEAEDTTSSPGDDVVLAARELQAPGVHGVSLELHAGEILGVGGLEGQGQRELFTALFGAQPVTGGAIEVRGEERKLRSPHAAIAAGIAFIPQDRKAEGFIPDMSVAGNITLASMPMFSKFAVRNQALENSEARRLVVQVEEFLGEGELQAMLT